MSDYAEGTKVSVEKSKTELETLITRYGAVKFGVMNEEQRALVLFEVKNRRIIFVLELPSKSEDRFKKRKTGKYGWEWRTAEGALVAWEQGCRERWRALVLVVKAKLEAVKSGITTFEDEFAMHFVMPDGSRLRDTLLPALDNVLSNGTLPPLLGLPAPEVSR